MKEFIDKLISRLEEESDFFSGEPMGSLQKAFYCKGVEKSISIVNQLAEEYNNGWISVEDRLPKEYTDVLVCDYDGNIIIARLYTDTVFGKLWRIWNGGDWKFNCIIAWQPLPAPYERNNKNE